MLAIRPMTIEDMPAAHALLAQLGYVLDMQEVRRRFDAVTLSEQHAVMVGQRARGERWRTIALVHVYCRGGGVGKAMMAAAEAWAADRGFTSVALASHISRSGAHAFYQALGYRVEATSHLMRKIVG